ncbi:MAG: hypothetical protein GY699_07800 [Desulfobacteraceae bacterium]|nr:hypothetical protein [Desulfobacteraceae bacterium]
MAKKFKLYKTKDTRIYVDDFEMILSAFRKMPSNWAKNSLSVQFPTGENKLISKLSLWPVSTF